MPFNCLIRNCNSMEKRSEKKSLFRVPKNIKRREEWVAIIQSAYPNVKIPKIFLICENHFKKQNIISENIIKNKDGIIIFKRKLTKKRLKDGANPSFTSLLKIEETLYNDHEQQQKNQDADFLKNSESNQYSSETSPNNTSVPSPVSLLRPTSNLYSGDDTLPSNTSVPSPASSLQLTSSIYSNDETLSSNTFVPSPVSSLRPTSSIYYEKQSGLSIEKQHIFRNMLQSKIKVNLPNVTWGFHRSLKLSPQLLFTQATRSKEGNMIIIKQVTINEDLQYRVLFLNKEALSGQHILKSLDDINLLLEHVDRITLCEGGPMIKQFKDIHSLCAIQDNITNTWRHKKCSIQTSGEEVCKFCVSLYKSLQQNTDRNKHRTTKKIVLSPSTRKRVISLSNAKRVKVQALQRQKLKQKIMTNIIERYQSKMKKVQKETLQNHLQSLNLPESQVGI